MIDILMKKVHRLEDCLSDIRKIAGWSGVDLGNMLGLSRQAISTIEHNKSHLSLAQYIAIRHLLDAWIRRHPENTILPRVIYLLFEDNRFFGKSYFNLRDAVSKIAAVASSTPPTPIKNFATIMLDYVEAHCDEEESMNSKNWIDEILERRVRKNG